MQEKKEYIELDVYKILQALLHRVWALILAVILFGGAGFFYASSYIQPCYTATALMYVDAGNSVSISDLKVNISSGELNSATSLVTPYLVILKTRITLNEVIRQAGLSYSYEELKEMISGESVEETPIFSISVTGTDPEEARNIANTITEVLPQKIQDVIGSCSIQTVDYAVTPTKPVSPNIRNYTVIGALLGFLICGGIIVLLEINDDSIHTSDDLTTQYKVPVLAEIPDLDEKSSGSSYKNYHKYYQYGYGTSGKKGGKTDA